MGSFNTSCFASRQTIAPNDRCMIVPIIQAATFEPVTIQTSVGPIQRHGFSSSACDPNRFWENLGGFMEARYSDYGRFEILDTPKNRLCLAHFIGEAYRAFPVIEAGSDPFHDLGLNFKNWVKDHTKNLHAQLSPIGKAGGFIDEDRLAVHFNEMVEAFGELQKMTQEQRGFWMHQKEVRPLSLAVLHKASFDALLNIGQKPSEWDPRPRDIRSRLEATLDEWTTLAASKEGESKARYERWALPHLMTQNLFNTSSMSGPDFLARKKVDDAIEAYLQDESRSVETFFQAIKPWIEDQVVILALEGLNLHFEPIVYADQDYGNEIGQKYTAFVNRVSQQVTLARQEENNDFESPSDEGVHPSPA